MTRRMFGKEKRMTIDEYWKKNTHCPNCRKYVIQSRACDGCKWLLCHNEGDMDLFDPTEECLLELNREVTE